MTAKEIWVLPEIDCSAEELSPSSTGLLAEAHDIATAVGGTVTALILGKESMDCSDLLGCSGVDAVYIFADPLLEYFTGEAYAAALLPKIREEKPWLCLMGHTFVGKDLAPRLAALLESGLVTCCARMDLSCPERPRFYRPVYEDQLHQEVLLQTHTTMFVTMDMRVLSLPPSQARRAVRSVTTAAKLPADTIRARHLEFLPADHRTVDVTEADVIVSAGMGAATDELLPLVEELAGLLNGAIGTTRPVIDGGKIPRERMIGQTGKIVSPDLYLALGISGATHHVGGIQGSGKIIAINRDPQAPIFQGTDVGVVADLRDILPGLIGRIKKARANGDIL